jgi:hypothetical protein
MSNYAFEYYLINETNNFGLAAVGIAILNALLPMEKLNEIVFPLNSELKKKLENKDK